MSKKSWRILYSKVQYKMGKNFLDRQYNYNSLIGGDNIILKL